MVKYPTDSIYSHSQGPVSVDVPMHGLLPLKSSWRCRISALQVPAHAPQLSQVVQAPSSEIGYKKIVICLTYQIYLHSQGPVSVEVPVQGLFPLKSIWRCLMSALQVPAQAPQLSHVVQAPSSEMITAIQPIKKFHWQWCIALKYSHSHGPVSFQVPVHGMLPL